MTPATPVMTDNTTQPTARWRRPRAYTDTLAHPHRTPHIALLRSATGHTLGIGLAWRRQRYLTWKTYR